MTRRGVALLVTVLLLVTGCTGGDEAPTTTIPAPAGLRTERKGAPPAPAPSREAAVRSHLDALQRGDVAASFVLLSDESFVDGLADQADWARRRSQLPAITGFEVGEVKGDRVEVVVRHTPGLDPFIGLSPAQERGSYVTRAQHGGFLVDAEPSLEAVLPPDDAAVAATKAWAERVQACDQAGAKAREAVPTLFTTVRDGTPLCGATGPVTVGPVARLDAGPASQDIVGQYSTDALVWARVVPLVTPIRIFVILAPIGNEWKVLGLAGS